jgi:predicted NBD/HSP70 family sugar kinase
MYLGIDIGGTKTLVAVLDDNGVITERQKFPTAKEYAQWKADLAEVVAKLSTKEFTACGVGVPGRIDRKLGIGLTMGNLPWQNVAIQKDVAKVVPCPVVIENDANLAGLSEAMLLKDQYSRVLYVTISTGIGTGIIVDRVIDPAFADSEGGQMILEHHGKREAWEEFASGRSIKKRFGKEAREITDAATWRHICDDIALGLLDLVAVIQPQVIVLGGGVGAHFELYHTYLEETLNKYATPLIPIPPLRGAARPEDAVVYGCYDFAKSLYGNARS